MFIEDIKTMLGSSAANFTDEQIELCMRQARADIEIYCNRKPEYDCELDLIANRMAIIQLNRIGSEGLASQGFSGVSETYVNGYPADIMAVLNRKRRIKVV